MWQRRKTGFGMRSRPAGIALQVALALACGSAGAAEPQGTTGAAQLPPVQVAAPRDPVEKSYRKIVKGMDLFEERHRLAPGAQLRFKLLPRTRDANLQGITLAIVGDSVTIPVPVAPDNTFVPERSRRALDEDALVLSNRKARTMTWRADIRTPGLPPNTRRLGDLRLECQVGMEADLVSNVRPFFGDIANFLMRAQGYCEQDEVNYLFFAERPLFSVTLVAGSRRQTLSVDRMYAGLSRYPGIADDLGYCDCQVLLDRTYYLPLGDTSWPDDTLVVLEYMDDGAPATASAAPAPTAEGRSR
jgi:hypothetical protein